MEILKRIFNIAVDCGKFNGKFAYRKGEEADKDEEETVNEK